jgi:hypothetical protein
MQSLSPHPTPNRYSAPVSLFESERLINPSCNLPCPEADTQIFVHVEKCILKLFPQLNQAIFYLWNIRNAFLQTHKKYGSHPDTHDER